ncbi:MAG TPA: GAP family protein [Mycobacteriales bacterium]|nr:GAP family protein [Mycobacteriales bacterium]
MLVLTLLLIGLVITLEPIPLLGFILVLASANGVRKGAAFIFGWLASLAIVIAITLTITGNNPPRPNTAPSLAALCVKLLIGAVLVGIAAYRWRRMGRPKPPKDPPKWQTSVDHMSVWFAMALGPALQPWGLVAAGVAVIVDAKISTPASAVAIVAFCVFASATYIGLELYAGFKPEETQVMLGRLRTWIDTHTDQVIIIASLVLGFWLIGQSLYALA